MSPSSTTPTFGKKTTDVRSPRPWILLILEEEIKEHTQEDAQQKNIMPVLIRETASHLRNVTPWTDSLEAAPSHRWHFSRQPPSTGSSSQEMVRSRKKRSVARRLKLARFLWTPKANEEMIKGSWRFFWEKVSVVHTRFLRCLRQWDHATT